MKAKPASAKEETQNEIASLIRTLDKTQQRLRELTGGEVDAVLAPGGQSYLLLEAQEKLRRSEVAQRDLAALQSSVLNALPAHIALINHEGVIISVNDGWRRFAESGGLQSSDSGLGQNYLSICDQAQGNGAREAHLAAVGIRAVLSGAAKEFSLEYPCPSPTEQRWFRLTAVPLAKDQPSSDVAVMHINITERKRAEESMRESEERFRGTFEQAAVGIAHVSTEGRFLRVNDKLCEIVGYERDELLGMAFVDLTFPEDRDRSLKKREAMLTGEVPSYTTEKRYQRKNGEVVWVNLVTTLQRAATGNPKYSIAVIEDISERKRTEARFRRLVESNAQGVIFWNTRGEITGANDAFLRLVGYTREDLEAGRINWKAMTPPEYAEIDRSNLAELAATGVCKPIEKEFIRRDGTRVPVLVGAATFEDNPEEGVCFVLDLTERKKLENQFLRAQRMESIGTLAGGIAHDLNNVLAPITMALDLLKLKFTDHASQELIATLSSSAQRGADMVRQVLSFARGFEGRHMEVQIKHLIRDVEKIANETFFKNIQVRTIVPNDLWTVLGDPTQLHQVLLNLCLNGRDAMPTGGTLTLSAENIQLDSHYACLDNEAQPGAYVCLEVADTGTGIPPEIMEKIFDPFFTTKEVGKGTGLGLSTSQAIIKSHGGFLRLSSELGKGTTFKVYLPARAGTSSEMMAERAVEMPRGHGELILVVDDEASVREITRQTLEVFGYRVVLASDGAEAVALFARAGDEIELVLTDMMMPVMDGPATIQVLRKMNPYVKIIAASGIAANSQVAYAASLGVKHFLPKPFTAESLLKMMRQVLNQFPTD